MITKCRLFSSSLLLALLLCSNTALKAQDATWFTDITHQAHLDSARSGEISAVDFNGDGYPDLFFQYLSYDRSMKTRLWMSRQNPDSANPAARIFVDVTAESNMYENRDSTVKGRVADCWGIADLNNDGFPDLVSGVFYYNVTTTKDYGDRMEVLLNDGTGHFKLQRDAHFDMLGDQASTPPGRFPATSFCFLDYDLDGILDIYVGTFSANHQQDVWLPGYLLKGKGDGTFINVTDDTGISAVFEPTYGASVLDWNNDGLPDIVTSPYCRTEGTLWKNEGDGSFTNVTSEAGYTSKNGMHGNIDRVSYQSGTSFFPRELCQWEAVPCDYDNDGDVDMVQMLVHGGLDPQEGHSPLTINGGASKNYALTWDEKAFDRPLINGTVIRRDTLKSDSNWTNQYGSFSLPKGSIVTSTNYGHLGDQEGNWIDLDGDGLMDFLLSTTGYDATNDRCYIEHQNPDHSFTEIAKKLNLMSTLHEVHSSRPFDYDLDGDDDFIIEYGPGQANAQTGKVWLMRNNVANTNNHTTIQLVAPTGCNKSCIGCRIWVYANGMCQMRDIQSGVGRWGMAGPLTQNFGLGKSTTIDSIVVRWAVYGLPRTTVINPPINKPLRINKLGVILAAEDQDQSLTSIELNPNPSSSRMTIHIPATLRENSVLSVYNSQSQLVSTMRLGGEEFVALPVETLSAGMYFVRIENNRTSSSKSFVKVD